MDFTLYKINNYYYYHFQCKLSNVELDFKSILNETNDLAEGRGRSRGS